MDSSVRPHVAAPTAKRLFVFGGVGLLVVAVVLFAYFGTEILANERKAPKGPSAIPVSIAPVLQERSEEHTSELQSLAYLVCRLLLENKKISITVMAWELAASRVGSLPHYHAWTSTP